MTVSPLPGYLKSHPSLKQEALPSIGWGSSLEEETENLRAKSL